MGQKLFIQCEGCEEYCEALPIPSDMLKSAMKSDDIAQILWAKSIKKLKQVMVICQATGKTTAIKMGR